MFAGSFALDDVRATCSAGSLAQGFTNSHAAQMVKLLLALARRKSLFSPEASGPHARTVGGGGWHRGARGGGPLCLDGQVSKVKPPRGGNMDVFEHWEQIYTFMRIFCMYIYIYMYIYTYTCKASSLFLEGSFLKTVLVHGVRGAGYFLPCFVEHKGQYVAARQLNGAHCQGHC